MNTKHGAKTMMRTSHSLCNLNSNTLPYKYARDYPSPHLISSLKKSTSTFDIRSSEIPPMERTCDLERLMMRPKHKQDRHKFDKTKSICLNEKENNPLTM